MYNRFMSFFALIFYAVVFYYVILKIFGITQGGIAKIIIAVGTIAVVDWTIDKINK